jgi:hypothetical protein
MPRLEAALEISPPDKKSLGVHAGKKEEKNEWAEPQRST